MNLLSSIKTQYILWYIYYTSLPYKYRSMFSSTLVWRLNMKRLWIKTNGSVRNHVMMLTLTSALVQELRCGSTCRLHQSEMKMTKLFCSCVHLRTSPSLNSLLKTKAPEVSLIHTHMYCTLVHLLHQWCIQNIYLSERCRRARSAC